MVIYEVNHDVDSEIEKEYRDWLSAHIEQMLGFDGFERVDWYSLQSEGDEGRARWSIHYHIRSLAHLDSYLGTHAERMRADGAGRFGSRYKVSRRILSLYRHFE